MTRDQFDAVQIGTPVTVFSFGRHAGIVIGKAPVMTLQGRTFVADGWIKVRLLGKPEWNGTFKDADITKQIAGAMGTAA